MGVDEDHRGEAGQILRAHEGRSASAQEGVGELGFESHAPCWLCLNWARRTSDEGARLRRLFNLDRFGRRLEESLDEEVHFHLQTRIDEFVRSGLSEVKARKKALDQFGDPDLVVQRCRRIDERGAKRTATSELARDIRQDVRFAIRTLIKARGFTLVSVLSLACGIGVFTAFFSMIDATVHEAGSGCGGSRTGGGIW